MREFLKIIIIIFIFVQYVEGKRVNGTLARKNWWERGKLYLVFKNNYVQRLITAAWVQYIIILLL